MVPTTYRQNVAIVVINGEGKMLACHRNDYKGQWQLPQGGIDDGESPEAAMLRELQEEIGTNDVEIVCELHERIRYDWPPELHSRGHLGQEQVYFMVRLRESATIDLTTHHTQEFDHFEWVTQEEFLKLLDHDHFKSKAYTQALQRLKERFPDVIV